MDSPVPQTQALYVLRGCESRRPYVAAVFSDLSSAENYSGRAKQGLVLETVPGFAWPLYACEFLDDQGKWDIMYVDREGLLDEIESIEPVQGSHVYMTVFKVPCDWLGHPRDLGANFMSKLQHLRVDNWFLDAYYEAGVEEFDWF